MFRYLIAAAIFFSTGCHAQSTSLVTSTDLNPYYRLVVENIEDNRVSVAVYYQVVSEDALVEKIIVGNAVTYVENIEYLEIDDTNDSREVLVTIHNRTSNYGARTGVIVNWTSGWRLLTIPDEKFEVRRNQDGGISTIEIRERPYIISKGIFKPER